MKMYLDCVACSVRQILTASRAGGCDEELQERMMREGLKIVENFSEYPNSPVLAQAIHRMVMDATHNEDLYREVKQKDIALAISLLPRIERLMKTPQDCVKAAALGNILDSAIIENADLENRLEKEFEIEFDTFDWDIFEEKLKDAKRILYIADNAGESVFDRYLLKHLGDREIYYATREHAILNDVTVPEAEQSMLPENVKIISSGSSCPGTDMRNVNDRFRELFDTADIVISKGQGNFETLCDEKRGIFFILKVKCAIVSKILGAPLNSYVFKYSQH